MNTHILKYACSDEPHWSDTVIHIQKVKPVYTKTSRWIHSEQQTSSPQPKYIQVHVWINTIVIIILSQHSGDKNLTQRHTWDSGSGWQWPISLPHLKQSFEKNTNIPALLFINILFQSTKAPGPHGSLVSAIYGCLCFPSAFPWTALSGLLPWSEIPI